MIGGNHIEILGREILRDGSVTVQASLSLADARRIAIAAQGLGGGRPRLEMHGDPTQLDLLHGLGAAVSTHVQGEYTRAR